MGREYFDGVKEEFFVVKGEGRQVVEGVPLHSTDFAWLGDEGAEEVGAESGKQVGVSPLGGGFAGIATWTGVGSRGDEEFGAELAGFFEELTPSGLLWGFEGLKQGRGVGRRRSVLESCGEGPLVLKRLGGSLYEEDFEIFWGGAAQECEVNGGVGSEVPECHEGSLVVGCCEVGSVVDFDVEGSRIGGEPLEEMCYFLVEISPFLGFRADSAEVRGAESPLEVAYLDVDKQTQLVLERRVGL